jgi:hypothetical protein
MAQLQAATAASASLQPVVDAYEAQLALSVRAQQQLQEKIEQVIKGKQHDGFVVASVVLRSDRVFFLQLWSALWRQRIPQTLLRLKPALEDLTCFDVE